jgi:hypothetical protein
MSKNIERCPKDVKKLVNPKTGRCVMETSPIIKKLISEGYTILVTPNPNQPEPSPKSKNNDVKVFKICPTDSNKLVNPNTGRCIMQTSPIVKKLMAQGWSIAFNDPGVTPLVIKPKGNIDIKKLKEDLDKDKDGIISINEYLGSVEITPFEEEEKKGGFQFLRTNTNVPRFLSLIRKTDPVFKRNLCWFNQKYWVFANPTKDGIPKVKIVVDWKVSDFENYGYYVPENHATLYNAPHNELLIGPTTFVIHPDTGKKVRNCKERYLAMALSLSTSPLGIGFYTGGHANVLIFDTVSKTIDRYDPHGTHCGDGACPSYDQNGVDAYLKKEFKKILPEYKFIDFSVACPNIGPQMKGEKFDRAGYCVTWSLMFTVLRILNPGKSPDEINKQLLNGTSAEIFSKMLKFAKFYSDIIKEKGTDIMADA